MGQDFIKLYMPRKETSSMFQNHTGKTCSFQLQAVMADAHIQWYIDDAKNPCVDCTLYIWKTVVKEYKPNTDVALFKMYTYDLDFLPNKNELAFRTLTSRGLRVLYKKMRHCSVSKHSFEYSLEKL